jgi:ribose-phosphate pyrophosphokinase
VIFFAFEKYAAMGAALESAVPQLRAGRFRVARYENGELHAEVQTRVSGQGCVILGSLAPPDDQLLSALLLAHTLKKEGASRVTAMFPYLGYARDDKDKPGQSLATAWVGALVQSSGCDQVVTVDVHSDRARHLFPVPVVSLSPAKTFADALAQYRLTGATLVAPDEGAIRRCEEVSTAAGRAPGRIAYFEKHRTAEGITHAGPVGEVGPQAVLVDDILDTGTTLISACEKLVKSGVEHIDVMVTHGLFTGARWKDLHRFGVKRIFCTDSVPRPAGIEGANIVELSIVPLLAGELLRAGNSKRSSTVSPAGTR